jgi:hypothetical protein
LALHVYFPAAIAGRWPALGGLNEVRQNGIPVYLLWCYAGLGKAPAE